jgi:hypothetical protein
MIAVPQAFTVTKAADTAMLSRKSRRNGQKRSGPVDREARVHVPEIRLLLHREERANTPAILVDNKPQALPNERDRFLRSDVGLVPASRLLN